jgi:hypothetical protein
MSDTALGETLIRRKIWSCFAGHAMKMRTVVLPALASGSKLNISRSGLSFAMIAEEQGRRAHEREPETIRWLV